MFGKHHIITQLAGAFAIVAVAAVVAASSATAGTSSNDRARSQACQTKATGWHVVTDDQGVPWLEPVGLEACTDVPLACTPTAETPTRSSYPGWAFTTDDLGRPWLVPVEKSAPTVTPAACVLQAIAPVASAPKASVKKASAKKTSSSPICRFRHAESVTGC